MKNLKTTICSILSFVVFTFGFVFSALLALAFRATRDYDLATLGNACIVIAVFIGSLVLGMYIRKIGGCKPLNLD